MSFRYFIAFLFLGASVAAAQSPQWTWKTLNVGDPVVRKVEMPAAPASVTLTEEHGLPSNRVRAIAFLKDGTVAIGTGRGLSLWRGDTITTYTGPQVIEDPDAQDASRSGYIRGEINALLVTTNGDLWAATRDGVCRRTGETWECISAIGDRFNNAAWALSDVQTLFETSDLRILAGARNAGVLELKPLHNRVDVLYRNDNMNNWVTDIAEERGGKLWFAVYGLGMLSCIEGKFVLFTDEQEWVPDDKIRSMCVDQRGALWVGTHDGIGVRHRNGQVSRFTASDRLPANTVWNMQPIGQSDVWIQTSRGFAVFDGQQWTYPDLDQPTPIDVAMVKSPGGDFWLGTLQGAIRSPRYVMADVPRSRAELDEIKKGVENQFPNVTPTERVGVDRRGHVWVAREETLLRYDGMQWDDSSDLLDSSHVYKLFTDSRKRVWIATGGAGLIGIDGGDVKRFNNEEDSARSVIYDLVEHPNGDLLVGTQNGLFRLSAKGDWELLSDPLPAGVILLQASRLLLDDKGILWFTDSNFGLFQFDGKSIKHAWKPTFPNRARALIVGRAAEGGVIVEIEEQTTAGPKRLRYRGVDDRLIPIDL